VFGIIILPRLINISEKDDEEHIFGDKHHVFVCCPYGELLFLDLKIALLAEGSVL